MGKVLLSIGECMVEMAATADGTYRRGFAGDTFNTTWYARRHLGQEWDVAYFTCVGDDAISGLMLDFMAEQGISTDLIRRLPNRRPGLYVISLDHGERSFSYWRDSSAARSLADDEHALRRAVASADAIYFSGITLAILPPDHRALLLTILADAKERGAMVVFDSNIRLRLWPESSQLRDAIVSAAGVSTIALPTVPDETELFGERTADDVAARYQAHGVAEVAVKAGKDAALVIAPGIAHRVSPATTVAPVDTTGAGDSFNGAYMASRLNGDGPIAAAMAAHAVAGRVIQNYGALVR